MAARSRRVVVPVAVAAGALALTAFGAAPRALADTGSGEAGYYVTGGTWSSVSASWAQPTGDCAGGSGEAAFWVGLDGVGSNSVEQAGTSVDCSGGVASYAAWYEMYPAAPVYLGNTVQPGDQLNSSVTMTAKGSFTVTLKDTTQGWSKTVKTTDSGAQGASAEIVAEVPTGTGSAGSGSVHFTQALVNGGALGSAGPQQLDSPGMTVSPIGSTGEDFTVSW